MKCIFHSFARANCRIYCGSLIFRGLLQILSRLKPAGKKKKEEEEKRKKQLPKLEEFLANRDYTGAITLLEVNRSLVGPVRSTIACNIMYKTRHSVWD